MEFLFFNTFLDEHTKRRFSSQQAQFFFNFLKQISFFEFLPISGTFILRIREKLQPIFLREEDAIKNCNCFDFGNKSSQNASVLILSLGGIIEKSQ